MLTLLVERCVTFRLSLTTPWPELCYRTTLSSKECLEIVFLFSDSDFPFPYRSGQ